MLKVQFSALGLNLWFGYQNTLIWLKIRNHDFLHICKQFLYWVIFYFIMNIWLIQGWEPCKNFLQFEKPIEFWKKFFKLLLTQLLPYMHQCALIHLLISALYKLFVYLLNFFLYFLPSLLLSLYLFPYSFTSWLILSTSSRIGQFCFQAGGRRRRPNLTLVFMLLLCCCIFCYGCMFSCVVFDLVFSVFVSTKPRDWLKRMSPKWPIFCRVGHKTLTQSINLERLICRIWLINQIC